MTRARGPAGFTLIELIIVVFLLAIFAAIAVPGFSRLIDNNRTQAVGNELLGLLQYARGYAVENRAAASVCVDAAGQFSVRTTCAVDGTILRVLGDTQGVALQAQVTDLQFSSNGAASGAVSYIVCQADKFADGFTVGVALSGQIQIYPRGQKSGGVAMEACGFGG